MSTAFLYHPMVAIHMAVNESHAADTALMTSDRYCRHCCEIALAYDPAAGTARCRACGELA